MSETCDICGRPTSTDMWCGPDECAAHRSGLHSNTVLELAACYRIGRERVMAERDALRAELTRLTTWHPASEPPDTERYVLVLCDDGAFRVDFWSRLHHRWDTVGVSIDATVTHWRELPPGPEVGP